MFIIFVVILSLKRAFFIQKGAFKRVFLFYLLKISLFYLGADSIILKKLRYYRIYRDSNGEMNIEQILVLCPIMGIEHLNRGQSE